MRKSWRGLCTGGKLAANIQHTTWIIKHTKLSFILRSRTVNFINAEGEWFFCVFLYLSLFLGFSLFSLLLFLTLVGKTKCVFIETKERDSCIPMMPNRKSCQIRRFVCIKFRWRAKWLEATKHTIYTFRYADNIINDIIITLYNTHSTTHNDNEWRRRRQQKKRFGLFCLITRATSYFRR